MSSSDLQEVVRIAGSPTLTQFVQPDLTPEDREALIEAGYDRDDPHVRAQPASRASVRRSAA
ncbi:hypothetical protein [Nocardia rhizosphaerae]|uniref:Uncharacterized protein n=1 Tax=Nocardia rhizosphaerae TaxID=1691571 RepID=A0ABV8L2X6_9NOCA